VPEDVLAGVARSSSRSVYGGAVCTINDLPDLDQVGSVTFMLAVDEDHAEKAMRGFCQVQSGIGPEVPLGPSFGEGCGYARAGWAAVVTSSGRALTMSSIQGDFSRESAVEQATRAVEALLPLADAP
jgi:hypothetical protein